MFRCRRLSDFGGKQRRCGVTGSVFIYLLLFISHTSTTRHKKNVVRLSIECGDTVAIEQLSVAYIRSVGSKVFQILS